MQRSHVSRLSVRRRGFTLIDVLVVICVLAILVSLLIPGVQEAREAARKATCKNNLKQMGLALHNFHDVHSFFPAAQGWPKTAKDDATDRTGISWMVYLLPYMDQPTLAEDLDPWAQTGKTVPHRDKEYGEVQVSQSVGNGALDKGLVNYAKTQIPEYKCPSALNTELTDWGTATASYAASLGYNGAAHWGFFSIEGMVHRMGQMTDGLSYTIAVSEAGTENTTLSKYEASDTHQPQWIGNPKGGIKAWRAYARQVRHDKHTDGTRKPNGGAQGAFNSGHEGGVHCLSGDGAVHFIGNDVDMAVWISLGTMRRLKVSATDGDPDIGPLVLPTWKELGEDVQEVQQAWPQVTGHSRTTIDNSCYHVAQRKNRRHREEGRAMTAA